LTKVRATTTFNSALPLPPLVYGIAGLVFVLLFASPLAFLPASPTTGPADVVAYYEHNQRALEIIQVVRALSVPAFLLFLSGLALMLRKVEGTPAPLTTGVVASGAVLIALALAILAARWSIALDAAKLGSPPAVQTVRDLADALQSFSLFPAASLIGLASWVLTSSRGATRVIGTAGVVFTAILLVGAVAAAFGAQGFAVTLLDPFWFIAVAVTMTIRAIRGDELAQPM
jgi:hypothetical protein